MVSVSPRAAIFDIGATLVTGPPVAPNKVIAQLLGCATAAEVASVIMTRPYGCAGEVCDALEAAFGAVGAEARSGITRLWESQAGSAVALPGAAETVTALKSRGLKIGLLSDIWGPYFRSVESALPGVIECADAIVLSFETGCRKPDEANFIRILSELGTEAGETVMVGDTYAHDILPALRLRMQAVWVLARPDREAEAIAGVLNGELPCPTATVRSVSEVAGLDMWARRRAESEVLTNGH